MAIRNREKTCCKSGFFTVFVIDARTADRRNNGAEWNTRAKLKCPSTGAAGGAARCFHRYMRARGRLFVCRGCPVENNDIRFNRSQIIFINYFHYRRSRTPNGRVCTYRPYILSAIRNEHIILYFVHIIYYGMEITPPDLYFYIFNCIFVVVEK